MCLTVKNSFTEVNEFVPPSELSLFNLDDIGCLVHCPYLFFARATEVRRNLSHCAPDVRRLLSKILDPNPKTRISMAKIMESSWFKRGLEKPTITRNEDQELAPLDADGVFGACENGDPIEPAKDSTL
ncbi:hypothetical protein JHK87_006116 [Glycine soja]|nr:hypothetical protein JHK87_006116 [Glycine soja]